MILASSALFLAMIWIKTKEDFRLNKPIYYSSIELLLVRHFDVTISILREDFHLNKPIYVFIH